MDKIQTVSSFFQRIPPFKGKRKLCRIILSLFRFSHLKDITVNTKSGRFFLPNIIEIISFDLFVNGYYESGLTKFLADSLPAHGVFIDVGANIGSISIPLAKSRPDIRIIAIEASPWLYELLNKNVQLNDIVNIVVLNYAAHKESGNRLPMYAPRDLFGKGSLNPVYTGIGELTTTITIDDVRHKLNLTTINFVKVDVEGFEAFVFEGMGELIEKNKPSIVFEYSQWAENAAGFEPGTAQKILLEKGYTLQQFDQRFHKMGDPSRVVYKGIDANLFAS